VVGLTWVWSFHWELVDPWVGPAIRHEAGPDYVRQAYASMMLCTLMHVVGMAMWLVLRRAEASQSKGFASKAEPQNSEMQRPKHGWDGSLRLISGCSARAISR
jgi:hypothetical protein